MKVVLELQDQPSNVRRITVRHDIVIGRGSDCNLRLSAPQISRRHCFLRVGRDSVSVTDLDSSNGTFINGNRIEANKRHEITDGTQLALGPIQFIIHVRSDVAVAAGTKTATEGGRTKKGQKTPGAGSPNDNQRVGGSSPSADAAAQMDFAVERAGESAEPHESTAEYQEDKFPAIDSPGTISKGALPGDSRLETVDLGQSVPAPPPKKRRTKPIDDLAPVIKPEGLVQKQQQKSTAKNSSDAPDVIETVNSSNVLGTEKTLSDNAPPAADASFSDGVESSWLNFDDSEETLPPQNMNLANAYVEEPVSEDSGLLANAQVFPHGGSGDETIDAEDIIEVDEVFDFAEVAEADAIAEFAEAEVIEVVDDAELEVVDEIEPGEVIEVDEALVVEDVIPQVEVAEQHDDDFDFSEYLKDDTVAESTEHAEAEVIEVVDDAELEVVDEFEPGDVIEVDEAPVTQVVIPEVEVAEQHDDDFDFSEYLKDDTVAEAVVPIEAEVIEVIDDAELEVVDEIEPGEVIEVDEAPVVEDVITQVEVAEQHDEDFDFSEYLKDDTVAEVTEHAEAEVIEVVDEFESGEGIEVDEAPVVEDVITQVEVAEQHVDDFDFSEYLKDDAVAEVAEHAEAEVIEPVDDAELEVVDEIEPGEVIEVDEAPVTQDVIPEVEVAEQHDDDFDFSEYLKDDTVAEVTEHAEGEVIEVVDDAELEVVDEIEPGKVIEVDEAPVVEDVIPQLESAEQHDNNFDFSEYLKDDAVADVAESIEEEIIEVEDIAEVHDALENNAAPELVDAVKTAVGQSDDLEQVTEIVGEVQENDGEMNWFAEADEPDVNFNPFADPTSEQSPDSDDIDPDLQNFLKGF